MGAAPAAPIFNPDTGAQTQLGGVGVIVESSSLKVNGCKGVKCAGRFEAWSRMAKALSPGTPHTHKQGRFLTSLPNPAESSSLSRA